MTCAIKIEAYKYILMLLYDHRPSKSSPRAMDALSGVEVEAMKAICLDCSL